MANVISSLYDRPSLLLRKKVMDVEIRTGNVPVILRKKWMKKPGWDHYVLIHYVELPDGTRGWMDDGQHRKKRTWE